MNRFSRTLYVLLGRDHETPGERAFRHERERIIVPAFIQAISGLCLVLAMILILTESIVTATQVLIYSLIAFVIVGFIVNAGLKWHQNKYGGD